MPRRSRQTSRIGAARGSDAGMIRRLFTAFSVMSLLLCMAMAAVWAVSYWKDYAVGYRRNDVQGPSSWSADIQMGGGQICLEFTSVDHSSLSPSRKKKLSLPSGGLMWIDQDHSPQSFLAGWGFQFSLGEQLDSLKWVGLVAVPCWFVIVAAAVLPMWWWGTSRRHKPHGQCSSSGYDLRASEDRCPECGKPIPVEQDSAAVSD